MASESPSWGKQVETQWALPTRARILSVSFLRGQSDWDEQPQGAHRCDHAAKVIYEHAIAGRSPYAARSEQWILVQPRAWEACSERSCRYLLPSARLEALSG